MQVPFIDSDFPVEEIDRIAWSESNSRKPIYHMHKWFARRVGCTYRALILASFAEENPMDLLYRNIELKTEDDEAPIILDPFMGGGTTIVEAHRLGCKTVGIDINPVAWFITKKELEAIDAGDAVSEFRRIKIAVGNKIRSYYATRCSRGHNAEIMYSFWVRILNCKKCGGAVPLFRTFRISGPSKGKATYYCPSCNKILDLESKNAKCDCGFDLTSRYATNKIYCCPHCSYQGDITEAWLENGSPPNELNFAIEYYCATCGRGIKTPEEGDASIIQACSRELARTREHRIGYTIPDQDVPWERMTTMRPRCKVYKRFLNFFNSRQLLSLSSILEEILRIRDTRLRDLFMLILSDAVNANNLFCIYNTTARKIEPLFGGHYFSPPMMPVENNVWGARLGRGTFSKYFRKAARALEYQQHPYETKFERADDGVVRRRIDIQGDLIDAKEAFEFNDLLEGADTLLKCISSEELGFIPDKSVDAIITDPPYYDNIMYSELSNLFYCWLRLGLKKDYPKEFAPSLSGREQEILVQSSTGKDREFYISSMVGVFRELNRVLKDKGHMIFVFQHKKFEAWTALLEILVESDFCIVSVYPSHGETPSGVRLHGANYNVILVCKKSKKKTIKPAISIEEQMEEAILDVLKAYPRLDRKDAFVISLGKALQIYSENCSQRSRPDFNLQILREVVQSAVDKIQNES